MMDFFQAMADMGDTIVNFLQNTPSYFEQFFAWLNAWWIMVKLRVSIEALKFSYLVATSLLDEIGFSSLFSELFNALPSELRYWGTLFKVPQGVAIWVNCATTALVMRMSR